MAEGLKRIGFRLTIFKPDSAPGYWRDWEGTYGQMLHEGLMEVEEFGEFMAMMLRCNPEVDFRFDVSRYG